jgi:predicted NUDIX family NTP pyrophosphohydrolase
MAKQSAGIFVYRKGDTGYEVLIVHPGGPFWAKKDDGSWSIPKGEFEDPEQPLAAAKREFQEETNLAPPAGEYKNLGEAKQSSGKVVHAFAIEADVNLEHFKSNMFEMEWPPKSGKKQEFPENDKAAWVLLATAQQKLVKGQVPLLEALASTLGQKLAKATPPENPQSSLF